jgi:hypothetical protein
MAIPSSTYTELVTTTLDLYRDELADNVTHHIPLLERLETKGNTDPAGGGVNLLENLMYAANSTVKWYSGLELLDVSQSDVLTSANFQWKELNANVVISGLDKAKNSGTKESVFNLVKSRIKVAELSLRNSVNDALFYSNTENSGKSIGGLQFLVADLPTSGVVGGIDRGGQTWWRNQYYSFTTQSVTASATTIQHAMNTNYIAATRGRDVIDMFVGGTTYFSYYLESLQANQRFMSDATAGAGFKSLKFWGGAADVFYDASCSATRLYGLNSDYLHFRPHSDYNFVTLDEKASVNQDATVVPIYWKGNMTTSNASLQSVILS